MGVRNAAGRYMHAMILPNQFTSDRVNPKSRTTECRSVMYGNSWAPHGTVIGYRAKPRPAGRTHSLQHKLSIKAQYAAGVRKKIALARAKTPTHRRLYSRYGPTVVDAPLLVEGTEVITLERDILSFWESKLESCLGETN